MKLAQATIACLGGAGLAWFGATRVWSVEVVERPGLSDLRTSFTGVDAQPWLFALALIALAGAGALLATRGVVRRGLGVLIVLVGVGVVVAAIAGRVSLEAGAAGAGANVWPVACVLGGLVIVLAGVGAVRDGAAWPVMGARYERRPSGEAATAGSHGPGDDGRAAGEGRAADEGRSADEGRVVGEGRTAASRAADNRAFWDALDRGDDPTTARE